MVKVKILLVLQTTVMNMNDSMICTKLLNIEMTPNSYVWVLVYILVLLRNNE